MSARLLLIPSWEKLARQANFEPEKMAALCSISLRQLERFFAGYFHKSPKKWMVELKCRLAQQLIAQGYSTKAAAAEFKFASETHFCHEFKKLRGASPQTFAPLYGSFVRQAAQLVPQFSNEVPTTSFRSNNVV